MKTQHAHLVALLVMLLVLVAYVAVLNTINITHPLLLALPAAVGDAFVLVHDTSFPSKTLMDILRASFHEKL